MKKRRVMLLLSAVVVVFLVWPGEREPEYQGKKLSWWLEKTPRTHTETATAVEHVGTNALPWLVKWLHCEPPKWKDRVFKILYPLPNRTVKQLAVKLMSQYPQSSRSEAAVAAFGMLGARASPAIPDLARLLNDRQLPFTAEHAVEALENIGPQALPVLLTALTNRTHYLRERVCSGILWRGQYWTNAELAVPALVQCLSDQNEVLALLAAPVLGRLKSSPELVVPALASRLQAPGGVSRQVVLYALGDFGDSARPAAQTISPFLQDKNVYVQRAAESALRRISPELLPKDE